MKTTALPPPAAVALALMLACGSVTPLPAAAQDGPVRQWLRERSAQRQAPAMDASTAIVRSGDYTFTLSHGGVSRWYRVHVPTSYDPVRASPLLVALHGGGGNAEHMAEDANYGLITLSEKEGVVLVFPNGFSRLKNGRFATWNAGRCCGGARSEASDDVGFIRQVVAQIGSHMNIDRERVFATGMSNGGMMAYRLACEASDVFRAIAAVAGTDNTLECAPQRRGSILHIHARNDPNVLFSGGIGDRTFNPDKVTEFTSVATSIARWVGIDSCNATPRRELDIAGAYCDSYTGCKDGSRVELCVTDSGGHSWPGAARTRKEPASQAISANETMWRFFNRK